MLSLHMYTHFIHTKAFEVTNCTKLCSNLSRYYSIFVNQRTNVPSLILVNVNLLAIEDLFVYSFQSLSSQTNVKLAVFEFCEASFSLDSTDNFQFQLESTVKWGYLVVTK